MDILRNAKIKEYKVLFSDNCSDCEDCDDQCGCDNRYSCEDQTCGCDVSYNCTDNES